MNRLVRALFRGADGAAQKVGSEMAAHMPTLYLLGQLWSFGNVVELGVGRGWSTVALLAGAYSAGRGLISYDLQNCSGHPAAHVGVPVRDYLLKDWTFRSKDSVAAAEDFPDHSVSLLFIDTNHRLEQTRRELSDWLPKIHPMGVICGHDYWLHEDPAWADKSGVKQAVDEFSEAQKTRFQLQVMRHDQGLYILWPKAFWEMTA